MPQQIVINKCYGGFGLSDEGYARLIELGVPAGQYSPDEAGGEVIYDRYLEADPDEVSIAMRRLDGRYWETWLREKRDRPLLVQVVEELGSTAASGHFAELTIVEVPDGVKWQIEEYDGIEHVAETHRTWS
ncbi:hypothetical protein LCGC14_0336600 [marine sediment metagenome]|uniref:Uncharacterized protein n=1 Tax=marine sediment metagenome TaxID=412755 RepID=A0A0F9TF59_9ZZZZ